MASRRRVSGQEIPAASSRCTIERFAGAAKKACTCAAITGPTSGTSSICSSVAVSDASSVPKCSARAQRRWPPRRREFRAHAGSAATRSACCARARPHAGRGFFSHAFESGQVGGPQRVQVGGRGNHRAVHQLIDEFVAQALDIHGAAAGKVAQRLLALRGAIKSAGAARRRFPFDAQHRGSAHRAVARAARSLRASAGRRSGSTRTNSGMTSPARRMTTVSPTRTSLRSISSMLCNVALLTYGAPHHDGFEPGDRREHAGAADLKIDFTQHRQRLIGRELVCHGPAGRPADLAQCLLVGARVDLIDHAIDLIRQLRASRCQRMVVLQAACRALDRSAFRDWYAAPRPAAAPAAAVA